MREHAWPRPGMTRTRSPLSIVSSWLIASGGLLKRRREVKAEGDLHMADQTEAGPSTDELERLRRELAHVNSQCQTAHAMAMDWRRRALAAEEQSRRLERKYHNLKKRKGLEHEADALDENGDADAALSLA
jgi:hypothetical protein